MRRRVMGAGGRERVRSWLIATSDVVMQGWGAVRDFATVKDALFSWSPKNTPIQRERSPMLFLLLAFGK